MSYIIFDNIVKKFNGNTVLKGVSFSVEQGDFVYIDAGTTTGYMLGYLNNSKSVFVTNASKVCALSAISSNAADGTGFPVLYISKPLYLFNIIISRRYGYTRSS